MSTHTNTIKDAFMGVLAELGIVDPTMRNDEPSLSRPAKLSVEDQLLVDAYLSGQIDEQRWQWHLSQSPELSRYFGSRINH